MYVINCVYGHSEKTSITEHDEEIISYLYDPSEENVRGEKSQKTESTNDKFTHTLIKIV